MQATFTTSALTAGVGAVTAVYGGDGTYAGTASAVLSQVVPTSSNAASGSTNNAATLPQGPLDPSSSDLSITGNYQKHYTEWGSNGSASFYLDVTDSSSFGASGETGTITYTAFLQNNGSVVVSQRKVVVPYSTSTIFAGGAVIPGVGLMAVGVDQILTGVQDIRNPGSPSMSVFQYLGYSGAQGLGFSESTSQTIGAWTPTALSLAFNIWGSLSSCFTGEMQVLTRRGWVRWDELTLRDEVASCDEYNPHGAIEYRAVEALFVTRARIWHVQVNGRVVRTTAEHPFYVWDKGWTAAHALEVGDRLRSDDGQRPV